MTSFLHRHFSVLIGIGLLTMCTGCGYHFRAAGEPIGVEIKSLAIPLMASTSSIKGFESDFTKIIREEFISHAKVPIVPKEDAQALLIGRIQKVSTQPLTYNIQEYNVDGHTTTHETTSRRRLKIKLDISLTDRATGKTIWHDESMQAESSYNVGTDPLTDRYNQQLALKNIARLLAIRIYSKTMERF